MKTRLITSLALPAAMATAGLLNTAATAYAHSDAPEKSKHSDSHEHATYGHGHHCPPMGNITWFDYALSSSLEESEAQFARYILETALSED